MTVANPAANPASDTTTGTSTGTGPVPQPPPVVPGTIQLWTDLLCPFAHVAVHRIRQTRERLGLAGRVQLDHHVFPLELFNGPHPRRGTDTEAVGLGQIAPGGRVPGVERRRRPLSAHRAARRGGGPCGQGAVSGRRGGPRRRAAPGLLAAVALDRPPAGDPRGRHRSRRRARYRGSGSAGWTSASSPTRWTPASTGAM